MFTFLLESTAAFSFFGSIFCLESGPLPPPETPAFWSIEVSITSSQLNKRLLAVTKESSDEELIIEPSKKYISRLDITGFQIFCWLAQCTASSKNFYPIHLLE